MDKKECTVCGTVYKIQEQKMIYRDKDSLRCEICGVELLSWNGAVTYSATLLKKGKKPTSDK